jgi:DNA polymerase delta subunit 2
VDQQVLLISVPKFSVTRTIVLVDLETMSVEQVEFNIAPATTTQSASQ